MLRIPHRLALAALVPALFLAPAPARTAARPVELDERYVEDVEFALDELERRCGGFFDLKDIQWKQVRKQFLKEAKKTETDSEHLMLLVRLLARLEDGHAEVRPLDAGKDVRPAEEWQVERRSPGFCLCRVGKKIYVKRCGRAAQEVGIEPGMEVVKIDGEKAPRWIEERVEELRDRFSFSTEQQAFFYATHWGLAGPEGTRLKLEMKTPEGKKKTRTATCTDRNYFDGPAVPFSGLTDAGDSILFGRTPGGFGYVHVRRVKDRVLEELDQALAELEDAPGLILDFRGNSGGGCDHDAFEARFVPRGHELSRMARSPLPSAGEHPYGGPIVVIVDATCRSSGETLSGMFKEDGRGYMIGDSATAGMSSQKETIELPSGLFALYVSVRSNRSSFNGGRGIEGIGVAPQELVEYDPDDLAQGVDTMLSRAEELLQDFPQKEVKYDPEDYDWGD